MSTLKKYGAVKYKAQNPHFRFLNIARNLFSSHRQWNHLNYPNTHFK